MDKTRTALRPTVISIAVASCFATGAALANPTGANVVRGTAAIHQAGNLLQITNSPNAIINWQSFSVGANEITRFLQQSPASAVLNRVTTQNPSQILGSLQSKLLDGVTTGGRVFLINPNGILFGAGAQIDVGGLVASTLRMSDDDFLAGRMRFGDGLGKSVVNDGIIATGAGGSVYLIGSGVTNSGIIRSPQGEVVLAAGNSVELVSPGTPSLRVEIAATDNEARNLGQIISDAGRIGIYAGLINNSGTIRADSAVSEGGRILLKASKSATLEADSVISASGASSGSVVIAADVVIQAGSIHADGAQGGNVAIQARNVLSAGRIRADGSQGTGGTIDIQASGRILQTSAAHLSADGTTDGGRVTLQAGDSVFGSGTLTATGLETGGVGGEVRVLGNEITLLDAQVDASGDAGGGTVLIGGDFQGKNPAVQNASSNWINFSSTVKADARANGGGGKVIVWSDQDTQFYGKISARGGAAAGDGGFIEVSGKENLVFGGSADAGAPNGRPGTLLLDPKFIVIDSAAGSGLGGFELLDPNPGTNDRFAETVVVLPNGNIVATDPNDDFVATDSGAVYLYNGATGALISKLTGSTAGDRIGTDARICSEGCFPGPIVNLPNGNFLVRSTEWNSARGAVTYVNGTTGLTAPVSQTNSLVGGTPNDQIGGDSFQGVVVLANGNYVVRSPDWDNGATVNAGAVTFASGATGITGVVSPTNSLVGSSQNDFVGSNVLALGNNYVVSSSNWSNGAATAAGAVTWVNGTNGHAFGENSPGAAVAARNSLVGSTANDFVGSTIIPLMNGNFLVSSSFWANPVTQAPSAGAVTFVNAATGIAGPISAANSLVGTQSGDRVGSFGVIELVGNGNYVVNSPSWSNGPNTQAGAVTWIGGTAGFVGAVSASNSLVGTAQNDFVGGSGVMPLNNGNYVVVSPNWSNPQGISNVGAVTWVNGTNGHAFGENSPGAAVLPRNSLVGSVAFDQVGALGVTPLTNPNGNYVVVSPFWDNGASANAGAVTFGNGATGIAGAVSSTNSLVGTTTDDQVGSLDVVPLSNGNYAVVSPNWNTGVAALVPKVGAVTWGDGTSGTVGPVSAANSLVGSVALDQVGIGGVVPLFGSNGNYVVSSFFWSGNRGAATWVNGANGHTMGANTPGAVVSSSNSLVGSVGGPTGDFVSGSGIVPLLNNGNYVVLSASWSNTTGAVTWGDGASGTVGVVSASNSLVGSAPGDFVGGSGSVMPLFNGNYLVASSSWSNGGATPNAGAITLGNGAGGTTGVVSAANSLVGSTANDFVGGFNVTFLSNGNYVIESLFWDNGAIVDAGAVTFGTPTSLPTGVLSASNSLVGTSASDLVGSGGVVPFFTNANGNYVVRSPSWDNGAATDAGAVTFGNGTTGVTGAITAANSLLGAAANDRVGSGGIVDLGSGNFLVSSPFVDNVALSLTDAGRVDVVMPATRSGQFTNPLLFGNNPSGTVTITPAEITAITDTGTAVILQANTDITLKPGSNIVTTGPSGPGGALTLRAGRSVLVGSNIFTADGDLSITANDAGADPAHRDSGPGGITMAAGTTLDAGTGRVLLTVDRGAGASGNIIVENVIGSDVDLQQLGQTNGSSILRASPASMITANHLLMEVDSLGIASGGSVGTAAAPMRVTVTNLESHTHEASPGIFIDSPAQGLTIGGVPFFGGLVKGVQNVTSGDISITASGPLVFQPGAGCGTTGTGGPICTRAGDISLIAGTTITSGATVSGGTVNAAAAGALTITGAINSGITNLSGASITQSGSSSIPGLFNATATGGDVVMSQLGSYTVGQVSATGAVTLTSGGAIVGGNSGLNILAPTGTLVAASGVGSIANPLGTQVGQLAVSGGIGDIGIINSGDLQLLGLSTSGSAVVGTTGMMTFASGVGVGGSLSLISNGMQVNRNVSAGGDLVLNAQAGNLDIVAGGGQGTPVSVTGNNIVLSGQNVNVGAVSAPGATMVGGNGLVTVVTPGNFAVQGGSGQGASSDVLGGAGIGVQALGNVLVTGGSGSGADAVIFGNPDVAMNVGGTVQLMGNTTSGSAAKIEAKAPLTIRLNFPLLSADGFSVNNTVNAIVDDVNNPVSGFFAAGRPAILNVNMFVTYGDAPVFNDVLIASMNQQIDVLADQLKAGEPGAQTEDKEKKKLPFCSS